MQWKKKYDMYSGKSRGFFQITKNNVKKKIRISEKPLSNSENSSDQSEKKPHEKKMLWFHEKNRQMKRIYKILRLSLWAMVCRVLGCHILANSSLLGEDLGTGTLLLSVDDDEGDFSSGLFSTVGFSVSPTGFSSLGTRSTDSCNIFRWMGSSQPSPSLKKKMSKLGRKVQNYPKK